MSDATPTYKCNQCLMTSENKSLFVRRYDRDKSKVRPECLECHRKTQRGYTGDYRKNRRAIIDDLKSVPCMDCGISYPTYVMDFDHREKKSFTIGDSRYTHGLPAIVAEAAKCDVVCSNCHRVRTHNKWIAKEPGGYQTPAA